MVGQFSQRNLIAAHGRIVALLLIALAPLRNVCHCRLFSFERLACYRETVGRKHIIKLFCHGILFNE